MYVPGTSWSVLLLPLCQSVSRLYKTSLVPDDGDGIMRCDRLLILLVSYGGIVRCCRQVTLAYFCVVGLDVLGKLGTCSEAGRAAVIDWVLAQFVLPGDTGMALAVCVLGRGLGLVFP